MLKKLRIKFVAITMAMVAVVLLVVFSVICVINYQQGLSDVYATLNAAISHGSQPPKGMPTAAGNDLAALTNNTNEPDDDSAKKDSAHPELMENSAGSSAPREGTPPEIGGKGGKQLIPVAVYSVNEDGSLIAGSTAATASIADEVLLEAAAITADTTEGSGLLSHLGLYYVKHTTATETLIAFADQGSANSWQTLALTLGAVGLGALLLFFIISLFFARWALKPIEKSWGQQQQFIADASHELKTPLTVMLASTSILLKHPEKSIASQSQWVESIETEADNMQRLVGDMLALAQPEPGMRESHFEPVNFSDLVERNLLQFEALAFEQRIEVTSSIDENLSTKGSESRLERLVSTLLDNAYKYAGERGIITVVLQQKAQSIELSITNSGARIAPADLPHIFDRFYRADKARERSVGGWGLGLAIAREVAEEHSGSLAATSSDDAGTTFTVTLPLGH